MKNVELMIGGRNFTVSCAAGEETHVALMGRLIDGKIAAMGDMAAQSESRMLLYAALLLADELHEARQSKPADPPPAPVEPVTEVDEAVARSLAEIADRLENLADRLEG